MPFIAEPNVRFETCNDNGTPYYYLYDYFSEWQFPNIYGEILENRYAIWNFKSGVNTTFMANKMSSALINQFGENSLLSRTLCIIPASTFQKTSSRFREFCSEVSKNTGINNGFDMLSNKLDRESTHNTNIRNIDYSSYINFRDINGKNILLFDDVITSGKSFHNIRFSLLKEGARSVVGIFLAKTVWIPGGVVWASFTL